LESKKGKERDKERGKQYKKDSDPDQLLARIEDAVQRLNLCEFKPPVTSQIPADSDAHEWASRE
jgi:hypothetical protein